MDILESCRNQHHHSVSVDCGISFFLLIHRPSALACSQLCVCMCVRACVCVCVFALSHSVLSDSLDPMDGSSTGSPVHGFSRQEYWIKPESPVSPVLQEDSIATEPSGKPSSQLHSCSNTPNVAQIRLYSIMVWTLINKLIDQALETGSLLIS